MKVSALGNVEKRVDALSATPSGSPLPEDARAEDSRAPDDPTRRLQQMLADIQKRAAA